MYYILHSQSKPEKRKCYQENNKRKYIHSTILYLSKKKLLVREPVQFKPVLFMGQLDISGRTMWVYLEIHKR